MKNNNKKNNNNKSNCKCSFKEFVIYSLLIYINTLLLFRIAEKVLKIKQMSYIYITLICCLGFIIYMFYKYILKNKIYKLLITIVLIFIISIIIIWKMDFVKNIFRIYFLNNITILNDLIYENEDTSFIQYKYILTLILPFVWIIVTFITMNFFRKFIVFLSFSILTLEWFTGNTKIINGYLNIYLFITLLTILIDIYIKKIKKHKEQGVYVNLSGFSLIGFIILVSFLSSYLVNIFPLSKEGKISMNVKGVFVNEFSPRKGGKKAEDFSLAQVGYGENNKKLGGPVSLNYDEALTVKSDKPYYLKGMVKDYYDGSSWKNTEKNFQKYNEEKFNIYGEIQRYSNNQHSDNLYKVRKNLLISHKEKMKTRNLFAPNYINSIKNNSKKYDNTIKYNKNQVLFTEDNVNEAYYVDIWNLTNSKGEELGNDILDSKHRYNGFMNYDIDYNINNDDNMYKYDNIKKNYSKYLQLPPNIPDRVYNLVKDITKDSKTSLEKVNKIREYLGNHYRYELLVSPVSDDADFVDYFLFTEKKGYCVYFASAMSIMCRIAGIPARYVEGFKMSDKKDEKGFYLVGNNDAHAWCEILTMPEKNIWSIAEVKVNPRQIILNEIKNKEEQKVEQKVNKNKLNMNKINNNDKKIEVTHDYWYWRIFKIISLVVVVMLTYIIIKGYMVFCNKKKIIQGNSFIPLYDYFLRRLRALGINKVDSEGDLEFAGNIKDTVLREQMLELVKIVYAETYGGIIVDNIAKEEKYKFIEEYMICRFGKFKYFRIKFFK